MRSGVLGLCFALLLTVPATAQWSFTHFWNVCADTKRDPDKRIAACNTLLQAGGIKPVELAYANLDIADAYNRKNDEASSLAFLTKAIQISPQLWQAFVDRIDYYVDHHQLELAREDYSKLLLIDPKKLEREELNIVYGTVEESHPNSDPNDDDELNRYNAAVARVKAKIELLSQQSEISHPK